MKTGRQDEGDENRCNLQKLSPFESEKYDFIGSGGCLTTTADFMIPRYVYDRTLSLFYRFD